MYRTVAQLDFVQALLASFFPSLCTRLELPEPSVQGRPVYALRMRSGHGENRRGVLLIAGTHSRELMNPDMLIELALDRLVSYETGNDLVLGGRRWPAADVKLILETLDLYLVPCINPDGREFVMSGDGLWRKNRRDNPGTSCDGIDLNRNLDILWGVTEGQTSCAPPARHLPHRLLRRRPLLLRAGPLPLGSRPDPDHRPGQALHHPAVGHLPAPGRPRLEGVHGPPRPAAVQDRGPAGGRRHRRRAGRVYTAQAGIALYPTTGTHSDYAYARHIASPGKRKVYGYTIETGPQAATLEESFHPANPDPIKEESESGVLALVQQCICSIELLGTRVLGREDEVTDLRRVRDELLATTPAGRQWIALFERVQPRCWGSCSATSGWPVRPPGSWPGPPPC